MNLPYLTHNKKKRIKDAFCIARILLMYSIQLTALSIYFTFIFNMICQKVVRSTNMKKRPTLYINKYRYKCAEQVQKRWKTKIKDKYH